MNRYLLHFLTIAVSLSFANAAYADSIDDFVKLEMQEQRIPGLSVAVLKDGKTLKVEGYGLANVEHGVPARPDTVYKIGSVSKQFIATGIMLLAEEGKLTLEDRINKYVEAAPETWNDITIRHLLTHTSGLVRESPGYQAHRQRSDADVITAAHGIPLRFPTGDRYEYSNLGYFIAADIIRKVSGMPWSEYFHQRVFAPLEMTATRVTSTPDIVPHRAGGYSLNDGKLANTFNWPAVRPSGAFLSTALDMAKWETALHTEKILKPASRKQMLTPATLNNGKKNSYGLGWDLGDFRGMKTIGHGGTLDGFRAHYTTFPDHGVTVIVLANLQSANPGIIAHCLATKYIPDADLTTLKPQSDHDGDLSKRLKSFLAAVAQDTQPYPNASPRLAEALVRFPESSRTLLANLLKNDSAFEFLSQRDVKGKGVERSGVPIASVRHYRITAADRTRYCTFYLDAGNKIASFEVTAI